MREQDDVPLHVALGILCIALLALFIAAINRRRIARFMNREDDDDWEPEQAVRCTVAGEDARISSSQSTHGAMWGECDYDCPPHTPVPVDGEVRQRDPLAEQLAAQAQPADPEHIYQEIRPRQNGLGMPRGLRASSDAFQ